MYEEYKSYVPDLNYWFNKVLMRYSILNMYKINCPALPSEYDIPRYTFIELLFNDEWSKNKNYYLYLYEEMTTFSWPASIGRRLKFYPDSKYFYANDSTSSDLNIFDLEDDDLLLLDKLLEYRISDATSTINFSINYDNLTTNLSKMIYIYLDLKINSEYERYDNELLISEKLLEYCYEAYLLGNFLEFFESKTAF